MNIITIKLINFQKHSDLTIDLKDGVNIIHGKSDVGKSCIRRALEWCLFGENISGIRKEETKSTTVTVIFDNNIELERIKSSSINRYILRKDGEEKTFDAIGRSVPQEIIDTINIKPIKVDDQDINLNVSRQLDAPFLIGREYSGSFRMKLFNKLTGSDILDKTLKKFNKRSRTIEGEIKRSQNEIEENTEKLEIIEKQYIEKEKLYDIISYKYKKIKKLQEKYDKLVNINKALISLNKEKDDIIPILEKIVPVSVNVSNLEGKIKRFETLKSIQDQLTDLNNDKRTQSIDLKEVMIDIEKNETKHQKMLKDVKICETCNQIIGSGQRIKK